MSLATVAFSRIASKIITPLSWTASNTPSSIGSAFLQRSGFVGSQQHQSIRSVFSEVIRQVPSDDPKKQGMLTFEDPDLADARIGRNIRGESPLRRRMRFVRHEKGVDETQTSKDGEKIFEVAGGGRGVEGLYQVQAGLQALDIDWLASLM